MKVTKRNTDSYVVRLNKDEYMNIKRVLRDELVRIESEYAKAISLIKSFDLNEDATNKLISSFGEKKEYHEKLYYDFMLYRKKYKTPKQ